MVNPLPKLPIVVSLGEPAGIGPDCMITLACEPIDLAVVVLADEQLLRMRAQLLGLEPPIYSYQPGQTWPPQFPGLYVQHIPAAAPVHPGQLNVANVPYVLECIRQAALGCQQGHYHAMVTGPVHKGIINDAGTAFAGHTEWLAELLNAPHPVMLLAAKQLRVALATTHLPLAAVPLAITQAHLTKCIQVLAHDLSVHFDISKPRILVCGLNPHAGEGGHLGREEIEVIIPVLQSLREQQLQLVGPVSADTAFIPANLSEIDAVLAMYHDQGLPVIKALAFQYAVNVTLGLPIIRTSVDHGTALALAGTGRLETGSFLAAIRLAQELKR